MKVAVIGGGGDIGARISQQFLTGGMDVRVISRKKSPRIARWGTLDFVAAEIPMSENELKKALQGCEVVVNCVVDKKAFESDEVSIESNKQGLKDLLEASIKLGVKKFIHLSSIAVLPPRLSQAGVDRPYDYSAETDWYTRVKIVTEKTAFEYKDKINLCVLRPGIVYGPYMFWSRIAFHRLQNFKVVVPAVQNSVCHAIHVDDLVGLIRQLIKWDGRLPELLHGIHPETVTWKSYYEMHAHAIGYYDDIIAELPEAFIRSHYIAQKRLLEGPGFKEKTLQRLRKIYRSLPIVLSDNPVSRKFVEVMKVVNRGLPFYTQLLLPPPKESLYPSEFELELYSTTGKFKSEMTGAAQGFNYQIPFSEGVRSAAAWWNFQV